MFSKRGVSPLIATVLLVMITVSIGAAVMVVIQNIANEGITSTSQQSELIKCSSDVSVDVMTVNSAYRFCINPANSTNPGFFALYLENTGQRDIASWRVTVIGTDGIYDNSSLGMALAKNSIAPMKFWYNGSGYGQSNISSIRISPQITAGQSGTLSCIEPNLEFDSASILTMPLCSSVTWDNNIGG